MRKVIDLQMEFWKKDIANIEFDLQSRDEIGLIKLIARWAPKHDIHSSTVHKFRQRTEETL